MNAENPTCQSSCVTGVTAQTPLQPAPLTSDEFFTPVPDRPTGMRKLSAATVAQWLHPAGRRVLLGYNIKKGGWEFGGGKNQDFETVEQTARRELGEETGWNTNLMYFTQTGFYEQDPEWFCVLFSVIFKWDEEPPPLPTPPPDPAFREWRWFGCRVLKDFEQEIRPNCRQILSNLGLRF